MNIMNDNHQNYCNITCTNYSITATCLTVFKIIRTDTRTVHYIVQIICMKTSNLQQFHLQLRTLVRKPSALPYLQVMTYVTYITALSERENITEMKSSQVRYHEQIIMCKIIWKLHNIFRSYHFYTVFGSFSVTWALFVLNCYKQKILNIFE